MGRFDALTQIEERPDNKPVKKLHTEAIVSELDQSAFFHQKNQSPTPLPDKPKTDTSKKACTQREKT
jgi:hypothetical protein